MMNDIEILGEAIDRILSGSTELMPLPPEYDTIKEKLTILLTQLQELKVASKTIASGNFDIQLNRYNPFIGPLKDLQSTFRHLTWQLHCVAEGDYEQSLDYLGEVSEAFNTMIMQLKERELLLRENVSLTKQLASQESQLLEAQIEHQVARYDQLSKSMREIKEYRHDMKNHLLCIDALLQVANTEEARQYIEQLTSVFKEKNVEFDRNNFVLNALLVEKVNKARAMKVTVKTTIKIRKKLAIENIDWCTILGNALDNALEALESVAIKQRKLEISVKQQGDIVCGMICNTMNHKLSYDEDNTLKTSKKDKQSHGIGIKNIQKCVKKYNGEVNISVEGNLFSLTFILCGIS